MKNERDSMCNSNNKKNNPCTKTKSKRNSKHKQNMRSNTKVTMTKYKNPLLTVNAFQKIAEQNMKNNPQLAKRNKETIARIQASFNKKCNKNKSQQKRPITRIASIHPRPNISQRKSTTHVSNTSHPPHRSPFKNILFNLPHFDIAPTSKININSNTKQKPKPKKSRSNTNKKPIIAPKSNTNTTKMVQQRTSDPSREIVPILGRNIIVKRKDGTKQEAKSRLMKRNQGNEISNISYTMSQEQREKIKQKFNHQAYCQQTNIKLKINDPYWCWHQEDDYQLIKQIKKAKRPPINAKANGESSKLKQLFCAILNEHDNGEYNDISNYRFSARFPCNYCPDCHVKLKVIPLSLVREGDINDAKLGTKRIGNYMVAAICSNYPDCLFPLYRPSYAKSWLKCAWYDDRGVIKNEQILRTRQTISGNNKIVNCNKRSIDDVDSMHDEKNENINNPSKKRKLSLENIRNDIYRGMQSVNSYDYLQSLSKININGVEGHQFNQKNLNRFTLQQQPKKRNFTKHNNNNKNIDIMNINNININNKTSLSDDQRSDTTSSSKSYSLSSSATISSQCGSSSKNALNIVLR